MPFYRPVSLQSEPGGTTNGTIKNLSPGGLCVSGASLPGPGAVVTCGFRLAKETVSLRGRVTWKTRAGATLASAPGQAGIEFVDLDRAGAALLARVTGGVPKVKQPSEDAGEPVRVWFDGVQAPVTTRARFDRGQLAVSTELPFLRLGSSVRVERERGPGPRVQLAKIESLSLEAQDATQAPRIVVGLAAMALVDDEVAGAEATRLPSTAAEIDLDDADIEILSQPAAQAIAEVNVVRDAPLTASLREPEPRVSRRLGARVAGFAAGVAAIAAGLWAVSLTRESAPRQVTTSLVPVDAVPVETARLPASPAAVSVSPPAAVLPAIEKAPKPLPPRGKRQFAGFELTDRERASVVSIPVAGSSQPSKTLKLAPEPGLVVILPRAEAVRPLGGTRIAEHPLIDRVLVEERGLGIYVRVIFTAQAGASRVLPREGALDIEVEMR